MPDPTPVTSPRRVAAILGTLVALTVVGSSAVAVAIPVVRRELDLTVSDAAWVFAVFQLAFAIATATFGRLADQLGLKVPLVIGVSLMTVGSLAVAVAPDLGWLLLGRAVQGIGGGAVPVLANAIVGARFSGAARTATFGTLIAVVSAVSGSGPVIGGGIEALLGWRWVFAIPALGVLLIPSILPLASSDRAGGRFDVVGATTTALAITGFLLLVQSPTAGRTVGLAGAALLLLAGPVAVWWTRRRPHGFLPAVVVGDPVIRRASAIGALSLGGYFAALFAVPNLIADALGWSPLQIGLALLPAAALGAVASRMAGRVVARVGHWRVVAVVAAAGTAGMLIAAAGGGALPLLLVLGLAGPAVGWSGANVAMTDRVTTAAPEGTVGVSIGIYNMVQFAGGAVGSALIGGLSGLLPVSGALAACAVLPAVALGLALTARGDRYAVGLPSPA